MWQGRSVQWTGKGTVDGNTVRFNYHYTRNKPSLWENGTMYLTRTNKKTLSGKWVTHSKKYQQAITFVQTRSDDKKAAPKPASTKECGPGFFSDGAGNCRPLTMPKEER
jgi:hypothetical protein